MPPPPSPPPPSPPPPLPPAPDGGYAPPPPTSPPPFSPLSFSVSFSVAVPAADLASVSPAELGAAALAVTADQLGASASESTTIVVEVSDTQRLGVSTGSLSLNTSLAVASLLEAVEAGLCDGLIGLCDATLLARRRERARALQAGAAVQMIEGERTYDYAASAAQTNLSTSTAERLGASLSSLGASVDSVELTALSVTTTITEVGSVTESGLDAMISTQGLAIGFAVRLPAVSLNVSAVAVVAPPLPPPTLPPPSPLTPPLTPPPTPPGGPDPMLLYGIIFPLVFFVLATIGIVTYLWLKGQLRRPSLKGGIKFTRVHPFAPYRTGRNSRVLPPANAPSAADDSTTASSTTAIESFAPAAEPQVMDVPEMVDAGGGAGAPGVPSPTTIAPTALGEMMAGQVSSAEPEQPPYDYRTSSGDPIGTNAPPDARRSGAPSLTPRDLVQPSKEEDVLIAAQQAKMKFTRVPLQLALPRQASLVTSAASLRSVPAISVPVMPASAAPVETSPADAVTAFKTPGADEPQVEPLDQ